jgi:hypothetical protein
MKCPEGQSWNVKEKSCDRLPTALLKKSTAAKELAATAWASGDMADHRAAEEAFDAIGKAALKVGFNDWGDEHKGLAHDHWAARHRKHAGETPMSPDDKKPKREGVDHYPVNKGLLKAAGVDSDESYVAVGVYHPPPPGTSTSPSVEKALEMGGRGGRVARRNSRKSR